MKIIAFGHLSRAGKTTCQQFLVSHLRTNCNKHAQKGSIAYKMKNDAANVFAYAGLMGYDFYEEKCNEHLRDIKLPLLDLTPVEIWVKYGLLLQSIDEGCLIQSMLHTSHKCDYLIISDLRRVAEAELIQAKGGYVIRVDRPESLCKSDIDRALSQFTNWNAIISNTGDLKYLHSEVIRVSKDLALC